MPPDKKWPPYVKERNGKLTYRPRIPAEKQHLIPIKSGFLSPPILLGTTADPETKILTAYKAAVEHINAITSPKEDDHGTLKWLYGNYRRSREWAALSENSRVSYEGRLNRLLAFPVEIDNKPSVLGKVPLMAFNRPMLKRLHKKILATYTDRGLKGVNDVVTTDLS